MVRRNMVAINIVELSAMCLQCCYVIFLYFTCIWMIQQFRIFTFKNRKTGSIYTYCIELGSVDAVIINSIIIYRLYVFATHCYTFNTLTGLYHVVKVMHVS
jgi:hypothetical protein